MRFIISDYFLGDFMVVNDVMIYEVMYFEVFCYVVGFGFVLVGEIVKYEEKVYVLFWF